MRSIGICTSSRSERHLMEALFNEINSVENAKKGLQAEMIWLNSDGVITSGEDNYTGWFPNNYDFIIIPADRSEMTKFALECFHNNIPFCHLFAGIWTASNTHDDINRWLISLMANFCFAETPECKQNLSHVGIPEDRILITGDTHFDGITNYDIEANKPKDAPTKPYDLILMNAETNPQKTWRLDDIRQYLVNDTIVNLMPNEDTKIAGPMKRYPRLEFLWLLSHCDHFISNSSSIHYEVPYINKFFGKNIKVINPSQRNKERTPLDPMYCKGASAKIAQFCQSVDLDFLRSPKRYPYMPEWLPK